MTDSYSVELNSNAGQTDPMLPDDLHSQQSLHPNHSCKDMKANSSGQDSTVHLFQMDTEVSFEESKIITLVREDGNLMKSCSRGLLCQAGKELVD